MSKQIKPIEVIDETEETQTDKTNESKLAVGICKAGEINEEERTVVAIISTGTLDRDNEILRPRGVNLDNFVKNPVVPWSHDAGSPPIAKAIWVRKGTKRLMAKIKFAVTDRAEEVWQLFKQGFLNAFSVGFRPTKGHRPTPDEIKASPDLADARWIYDEWELLEFSPVTIPSNPEALAQAVKANKIALSSDVCRTLDIESEEEEEFELIEIPVSIPVSEIKSVLQVEPIMQVTAVEPDEDRGGIRYR